MGAGSPFLHTVYMALIRRLHTRALACWVTSRGRVATSALSGGRSYFGLRTGPAAFDGGRHCRSRGVRVRGVGMAGTGVLDGTSTVSHFGLGKPRSSLMIHTLPPSP